MQQLVLPFSAAAITSKLEAATISQALTSGVATTVTSWLVDSYGSRTLTLQLTKTDGTHLVRQVQVTHNGVTAGADATTVSVSSGGNGTSADLTSIDATLSGAGAAQLVNLQVTVSAVGWTASVVAVAHKAA